nr:MAG TPA: hypothetical protein [Caudoviricetes sp.]
MKKEITSYKLCYAQFGTIKRVDSYIDPLKATYR